MVRGSSGLADLIADSWVLMHDTGTAGDVVTRDSLGVQVRDVFDLFSSQEADVMLNRIMNVVAVARKVVVFDMETTDGDDFDLALLNAMEQNLKPRFNHSTGRAITASLAANGLDESSSAAEANPEKLGAEYTLHMDLLRLAMMFDRKEECVKHLKESARLWDTMRHAPDGNTGSSKYFPQYDTYRGNMQKIIDQKQGREEDPSSHGSQYSKSRRRWQGASGCVGRVAAAQPPSTALIVPYGAMRCDARALHRHCSLQGLQGVCRALQADHSGTHVRVPNAARALVGACRTADRAGNAPGLFSLGPPRRVGTQLRRQRGRGRSSI